MRTSRTILAALAAPIFAVALHLSLGAPVSACGFHATIFSGEFAVDWENLKKNSDKSMTQMAIQELLRILCYVDPYNSAPDSPPWMHSEDGRTHARECAIAILHELGPKAAPLVWEALMNAVRFQSKESAAAMLKVRAAQGRLSTALGNLRTELSKDPNLTDRLRAVDEKDVLVMQEWNHLISRLNLREAPVVRNRMPPVSNEHRSVPADRLPNPSYSFLPVEMELAPSKAEPRIEAARTSYTLAMQEMQQAIVAYNHLLAKSNPMQTMDSNDMVPCDEYVSDLQTVLIRIGADALPAIRRDLRNLNRDVAAMAQKLCDAIASRKEPAPAPFVKDRSRDARRIAGIALACWDLADPARGSRVSPAALETLKQSGLQGIGDLIDILGSQTMKLKLEAASALELLTGEKLGENAAAWRKWYAEALEAEKRKPLPPDLATEGLSIGLTPDAKKNPPKLLKLPERTQPVAQESEGEQEPSAEERVKNLLNPAGHDRKAEAEMASEKTEAKSDQPGAKSRIDDEDADRKRYDP